MSLVRNELIKPAAGLQIPQAGTLNSDRLLTSDASGNVKWKRYTNDWADWIYWGAYEGRSIGRARLDGTDIDKALVLSIGQGNTGWPQAIYVANNILLWSDWTSVIGRGKADGGATVHSFLSGLNAASGVCTDGTYIYFTQGGSDHQEIYRTRLDGTDKTLLLSLSSYSGVVASPFSICTDGVHLYWCNTTKPSIGRCLINGSSLTQDFINLTGGNWGSHTGAGNQVAIDSNYIWCTQEVSGASQLGRANIDGSDWRPSFITGFTNLSWGCASDGTYVYWSEYASGGGSIGRAKVDGTEADHNFITGINGVGPICVAKDI